MNPPSEFKGGREEDIQQWLSQMKDYLNLSRAEWKEWVPIAVTFLKEAAYEWWLSEVRRHNKPNAYSTGWNLKNCVLSVGIG